MCATCGCDEAHVHEHEHEHEHERRTIRLEHDLLAKNDRIAAENRRVLGTRNVTVLNLIGSPGAGKTTLLERTIAHLRPELALAVVEGDQATDRDAMRIKRAGGRSLQVNTGAGCHLDAEMVAEGLAALAPERGSVVFVENVGNLVCPALFDVGEREKIVVMSVTEGDDKPLKYPHVFRAASRFVLTKIDLAPHVDFDIDACLARALEINPRLETMRLSARSGEGMQDWCSWVRKQAAQAS